MRGLPPNLRAKIIPLSRGADVLIYGKCALSDELHAVTVSKRAFERWQEGELIQNAMPDLSRDDREFLITGLTAKGFQQATREVALI